MVQVKGLNMIDVISLQSVIAQVRQIFNQGSAQNPKFDPVTWSNSPTFPQIRPAVGLQYDKVVSLAPALSRIDIMDGQLWM